MKIKPGVHFNLFHTSMVAVIVAVELVWCRLRLGEPVLTSGTDGEHMATSKHRTGEAGDFRNRFDNGTPHPLDTRAEVTSMLKAELGPDYDVVAEHDHYHIEHDPKGGGGTA